MRDKMGTLFTLAFESKDLINTTFIWYVLSGDSEHGGESVVVVNPKIISNTIMDI